MTCSPPRTVEHRCPSETSIRTTAGTMASGKASMWRSCPAGATFPQLGLGRSVVSYRLTLVTFCTKIPSDHSRNDGCLLEPLGCSGGSATGFGQVVAIGACDALDHPDVEQPA